MDSLISEFLASAGGSGVVVWLILRVKLAAMDDAISDAKKTAVRAHDRIDRALTDHK